MITTKRALFITVAAVFSSAMLAGDAAAGELDARMAKIVKTFTHAAAEAGVSTATLAVMPFQTDKKLAEKRVNYACAEILTNRLIETKTFKVTERARLEEVMQEQRLGLSGAVESATAAKVGKLTGARLVILGSVSRLGANYHLSTEMVDSETGEILASDVTEVAVEVFDKDASKYITEVPEYDTIGLYLAGGAGPVAVKKLSPVAMHNTVTLTPTNKDVSCGYMGVGVRYAFSPKWLIDGSILPLVSFGGSDGVIATGLDPAGPPMTNVDNPDGLSTTMYRLFIDRTLPVSRFFRAHVAAGVVQFPQFETDEVAVRNGVTPITIWTKNDKATLPAIKIGLEWKPKPRFGWSVSGLYYIGKMTAKTMARYPDYATEVIQQYDSPAFTFETNLSVYF